MSEIRIPAVLGWSNPDTGPHNTRVYATDRGNSPRWAKPRARVIEDALAEAGAVEGDRIEVIVVSDRFGQVPDRLRPAAERPEGGQR